MSETIILSRQEAAGLLTIDECIDAVEAAFKMFAEGKAGAPKVLGLHVPDGGLHIKAGVLDLNNNYIVAKLNSNFPSNPVKNNLPTIQGLVAVFSAGNGMLLALMDSIEITIVRTGAATGVAARYLARENSQTVTICGCGSQGIISIKAIASVRNLRNIFLYDTNRSQREKLSGQLALLFKHIEVIGTDDFQSAAKQSDIIVTCTPSRTPIIDLEDVRPGTFIAAVGTDSEYKSEIHPRLIAAAKLITDFTEQSATIGDLHHAIEQGYVTRSHVHAELGEIITGQKAARENDGEIIVFDSTGTALQDVAAASIVYERAKLNNIGTRIAFQ